ncbi:prisilkin-39 [Drosophila mojavensis]|uniref:Uncharacterized protein n=1 Tax=Drosophila mojavensis TaxID=7230 RepID=B4L5J7_DROMO|nr:prisilkin-39 [Drosophila mojavensis]EDW06456.2 uncharacterized protein Dmoj_GI21740 [Drosophila mojavensis]
MHSISVIALIASLALCAADVSHLPLSRSYLPPLSGAGGYSAYSSYPSYTGNSYSSGAYYPSSRLGSGYNSGYRSGYNSGLGSGYVAPLVTSGYNSYAAVPQYNTYATPTRTYLPVLAGYSGAGYSGSGLAGSGYSGLDTKYASNGGYIY